MQAKRSVDLGSHSLEVSAGGNGARHFLCLHGLVDTLEIWSRLTPALEARGQVLCVNQRGHGSSDAPPGPYAREDLARDVIRILDLEGVDQTVLVGHSMGGIVAMEAALAAPDRIRGLVLIGTTSACREKVATWYERIAHAGETEGLAGIRRAIYGDASKKEISGDALGIAHVTRMLTSLYTEPLTPKLAKVGCPVLLQVGAKDPMGPKASEIVYGALPSGRAELITIPNRGHWLQIDSPDEVASALDVWLEKFAI